MILGLEASAEGTFGEHRFAALAPERRRDPEGTPTRHGSFIAGRKENQLKCRKMVREIALNFPHPAAGEVNPTSPP